MKILKLRIINFYIIIISFVFLAQKYLRNEDIIKQIKKYFPVEIDNRLKKISI